MRWDDLFTDLEAQFDALQAAELAGEVADRTRRERARIRLVDRLRATRGATVMIRVDGGLALSGRVERVGPDWLLLSDSAREGAREGAGEIVLPATALLWIAGLSTRADDPAVDGVVAARLDLSYLLRGIARDRSVVTLTLTDGGQLSGTIDRVGSDHLDIADHDPGEPRRPSSVRAIRTIPFAGLAAVRRREAF